MSRRDITDSIIGFFLSCLLGAAVIALAYLVTGCHGMEYRFNEFSLTRKTK